MPNPSGSDAHNSHPQSAGAGAAAEDAAMVIDFVHEAELSEITRKLLTDYLFKREKNSQALLGAGRLFNLGRDPGPSVVKAGQLKLGPASKPIEVELKQSLLRCINKAGECRYQIVEGCVGEGSFAMVFTSSQYLYFDKSTKQLTLRHNLKPKVVKHITRDIDRFPAEQSATVVLHPTLRAHTSPQFINATIANFGNTLEPYVQAKSEINETDILHILSASAEALNLFHQTLRRSHGDVKPENICFRPSRQQVKVIDFGLSQAFTDSGAEFACSPGYCAPEISLSGSVSGKSDVYALGVTAARLMGCQTTTLEMFQPGYTNYGGRYIEHYRSEEFRLVTGTQEHKEAVAAYHGLSGKVLIEEFTRVASEKRKVLHRFVALMTERDPNNRPDMSCCHYFFDFMQSSNSPRDSLLKALATDFRIEALETNAVLALNYALAIVRNPDAYPAEHQALMYALEEESASKLEQLRAIEQDWQRQIDASKDEILTEHRAVQSSLITYQSQLRAIEESLDHSNPAAFDFSRCLKQLRKELQALSVSFSAIAIDTAKGAYEYTKCLQHSQLVVADLLHNPTHQLFNVIQFAAIRQLAQYEETEGVLEELHKQLIPNSKAEAHTVSP